MREKMLILAGIVLTLFAGIALSGCDGKAEQPPTTDDMVKHVQNSWKAVATIDEIRQVLSLNDPKSLMPFKSEVGGILTINSMKNDIDNGRYGKAAKKGVEWLLPFGLKEIGLSWLSGYVSLAKVGYEFFEWLFEKASEDAFNAQVQYYLWYREDGISEEEMKRDYAVRDGYLQNPRKAYGSIQPAYTSKFTPEDVFRVGRAFWEARQAEQYRSRDETAIRDSFLASLERLRGGATVTAGAPTTVTPQLTATPIPTATATPTPVPIATATRTPTPTATAKSTLTPTATLMGTPTPTPLTYPIFLCRGEEISLINQGILINENKGRLEKLVDLDKDGIPERITVAFEEEQEKSFLKYTLWAFDSSVEKYRIVGQATSKEIEMPDPNLPPEKAWVWASYNVWISTQFIDLTNDGKDEVVFCGNWTPMRGYVTELMIFTYSGRSAATILEGVFANPSIEYTDSQLIIKSWASFLAGACIDSTTRYFQWDGSRFVLVKSETGRESHPEQLRQLGVPSCEAIFPPPAKK